MKTIKVFKTTVDLRSKAREILDEIRLNLPESNPSFDLEDRDNVLRVEIPDGNGIEKKITAIVEDQGFQIEKLL